MKKQILFLVLFMFSAININAADEVPLPDMPTLPTRPRVLDYNIQETLRTTVTVDLSNPVTVDLSDTDLYLNFTNSVGIAVIMITNSKGLMTHNELLDTDTDKDLHISFENWDSGNYTLTIEYGGTSLIRSFKLKK